MTPIISIIIATYNASSTIRNCLESIVLQLNDSIELLVIDGGSTDGTQLILNEYLSKINYYISERDCGIYDAWNKGISQAQGDWILFLGADDTLEPEALAKYCVFLNTNNVSSVDFICAKNSYLDKHGQVLKIIGVPWQWEQFQRSMKLAHVASLHRRTLFQEVGPYDLRFAICGDYELLLRKKDRLRCLFVDTCIARMSTGGISFSMWALWEAHQIRRLHSKLSIVTLVGIYLWQVFLFLRHKMLHLF